MSAAVVDRVALEPDRQCRRCARPCHREGLGTPHASTLKGRGLCGPCYTNCRYDGTLCDWPSIVRTRDDLLDDYVILRRQGYNWRDCAKQLGLPYKRFERAMYRARKANDPRAARLNERGYPR